MSGLTEITSVTVIFLALVRLWAFFVNAHLRGCLERLDEILQAEKCTRPQQMHAFQQHREKMTNHTRAYDVGSISLPPGP